LRSLLFVFTNLQIIPHSRPSGSDVFRNYFYLSDVQLSKLKTAMQAITIDQIRANYPDQWVLLGNPKLNEPDVNGSIVSKLVCGIVLFASKDKRELAYKAAEFRNDVAFTACIYTGEIPKNKLFLL
jgi:hypothetical protein